MKATKITAAILACFFGCICGSYVGIKAYTFLHQPNVIKAFAAPPDGYYRYVDGHRYMCTNRHSFECFK